MKSIKDWPDVLLNLIIRFQAWRWKVMKSRSPEVWRVDATFPHAAPFPVPCDCPSFEEMQQVLQACEAAGAIRVDVRRL